MKSDAHTDTAKPLILNPGEGRQYSMGRMSACFKADCDETGYRMSASEWWLEPNTDGPPVHSHPEDHLYYLLEGEIRVFINDRWHQAKKCACLYIPGGTEHSFENRGDVRAGFLSINTPGGFESEMPGIVQWFKENESGSRRDDVQPDGQAVRPATAVADIDDMSIEEERYDVVLDLNILQLMEELEGPLSRIHAMLKPGGYFISSSVCIEKVPGIWRFVIPVLAFLRPGPRIKGFSEQQLLDSVEQAGFSLEEQWNPEASVTVVFLVARKLPAV